MTALFEKGREGFLAGTYGFTTSVKCALLSPAANPTAGCKAITGATVATPIAITCTAHGFANGDIILVKGVGGNLAANGIWQVSGQTVNAFNLVDYLTAGNSTGLGSYTSGGYAINLGPSSAGQFWNNFSGALVGTAQAIASPTVTAGVADAADVTFTSVSGSVVDGIALYFDTGTASTSTMIMMNVGSHLVTADATAASSATTIVVEPLAAAIPNSTTLTFSGGHTAVLSALANQGDRSLTVTALAAQITAGERALAPVTGSNLPITPNGGNITVTWDNGANKIFKL